MTDMVPAGISDFIQIINYDEAYEACMKESKSEREK